jgi:type I restriction enzyme S subunit
MKEWPSERLGDVSDLLASKSISSTGDTEVRAVTTACLSERGFLPGGVKQARMYEDEAAQCRLVVGEILVARSNTSELVGRASMYSGEPADVVASDLTIRIKPGDRIAPPFLAAVLSYLYLSGYWKERAGGASGSMKKITREQIKALQVPVPPLAEQQRVAEALQEQMGAGERARAAAEARLEAAEALPAAYLRDRFGSNDWPVRRLGDGLAAIESGTSVRSLERPATGDEWGVLKVSAVSWGRFRPEENKAVPPKYRPQPGEEVQRGDLLISRCNTVELVGAVVLVREAPWRLMLSDKTLRLVPKHDCYQADFLQLALRTPIARKFIESRATGTSYSMRNISQETISGIPVPTPPIDEQARFAVALASCLDAADLLITRCGEELAAIEALPAALLRTAFQGTS